MPTYDNNGTANYEAGKVYDFDGTSNRQIGKLFDNRGGVNSLIYSAEDILIDGNNTGISGGWIGGNKPSGAYRDGYVSGGLRLSASPYIMKQLWTQNAINLSNYNKMTVTYQIITSQGSAGVNDARGFAILAHNWRGCTWSAPQDWNKPNWQTTYAWNQFCSHIKFWDGDTRLDTGAANITTGWRTKTVNISGWTGSLYLGAVAICSDANTFDVLIQKIILE